MNQNSNSDSFIFNFPSDFIPKALEDRYMIFLKDMHKPYGSVLDYINSNIKEITLPSLDFPSVAQKKFYGKEQKFRGSISPYDAYTRETSVTMKDVDFHMCQFICQDAFLYHYGVAGKPYVDPFVITVLDNNRREFYKIYLSQILCKSTSDIRLAHQEKSVEEKTFTLGFTFNYVDVEYIPRYGSDTTDGTPIDDNYYDKLKKNEGE